MKAYKEELFENTFLRAEAEQLEQAGFIHSSQTDLIEKNLPAYQGHSNLLARLGIFILACLVYTSTCGLISFLLSARSNNFTGLFFTYMVVGFFGLELLIKRFKYFANGADDAFLLGAQISTLCFVGSLIFEGENEVWWSLFLTATLLGVFCCIRYVDSFAALIACLGLTGLVINLLMEAGNFWRFLLPFVLLFLAFCIHFISRRLKKHSNEKGYYTKSLNLGYTYSLFLFYLSCNYFVVREANEHLMDTMIAPGEDISWAFFFYAFTILVPPVYIYMALRNKNRTLLWVGFMCLAIAIATIRYYYAVVPLEMALLLGGGLLFLVAYLGMKKLKEKTEGLSFEKDKFQSSEELVNAEALVLIQNFSPKVVEQGGTNSTEFGGGEFGGGGSGETY